jgi:hypothetical protein
MLWQNGVEIFIQVQRISLYYIIIAILPVYINTCLALLVGKRGGAALLALTQRQLSARCPGDVAGMPPFPPLSCPGFLGEPAPPGYAPRHCGDAVPVRDGVKHCHHTNPLPFDGSGSL